MEALFHINPAMDENAKRSIVNEALSFCSDFIDKKINATAFHTNYIGLVKKV